MPRMIEGKLERISGWVYDVKKRIYKKMEIEVLLDDGTRRREWLEGDLRELVGKRVCLDYGE